MARARNIKPGFFQNEVLVELPFFTRLLFIGLWTLADREGRLEDKPKRIKMNLFPADDVDIDESLSMLASAGFLQRYVHGTVRFIQVLAFAKHQNPHKDEKASSIPAPCELSESTVQAQDQHDGNRADSPIPVSPIPDSGLVDSPQTAPAAPKKARKSPKTRLPDGFEISETVKEWARNNGHTNLQAHFENFIGKAKAIGYEYVDWDQALKNAITADWAKLAQARASPQGYESAKDRSRRETNEALTGKRHEQRSEPHFIDLN